MRVIFSQCVTYIKGLHIKGAAITGKQERKVRTVAMLLAVAEADEHAWDAAVAPACNIVNGTTSEQAAMTLLIFDP